VITNVCQECQHTNDLVITQMKLIFLRCSFFCTLEKFNLFCK